MFNGERTVFSTNGVGLQSACRRIYSFLCHFTNLKCKLVKDLHIIPGTLKQLGEIAGETLDTKAQGKIS